MRQPRITIILLSCFVSLIVGSCSSIFAQQPPQAPEKERGIELYRKGNFNEAVKLLQEAVKKQKSDSDAWHYLGLSLRDAGKIIESHCIVGWVRLKGSAAGDALARAEEALKIKSDYPEALILKTQALVSMFAQAQIRVRREAESRTTGDQPDDPAGKERSRARFALLKQAAESLEAYLKLKPEKSEQALWGERLESLRVYGKLGTEPDSGITLKLRPEILYLFRERMLHP